MPVIKGCIYILTHFLTSQPALIKLDNENIGGHLTPLHLYLMIVSVLQNVIRKILRHRPYQNFLPGVLCVTQGHRITYRYVPQGSCGLSQVALTQA